MKLYKGLQKEAKKASLKCFTFVEPEKPEINKAEYKVVSEEGKENFDFKILKNDEMIIRIRGQKKKNYLFTELFTTSIVEQKDQDLAERLIESIDYTLKRTLNDYRTSIVDNE